MNKNSLSTAFQPLVRWLAAGIIALPIVSGHIEAQSTGILFPHGGESVEVGDTISISWNLDEESTPAKVVLWTADAGSWAVLTEAVGANDTTWQWIPSGNDMGNVLRIGISDSSGAILALCRGYFSVRDSGSAQRPAVRSRTAEAPSIRLTTIPNPGTEVMRLEWGIPVTGTLQIVAANGTVIRSVSVAEQAEYRLDPDGLAAGSYLAILHPENGIPITQRIVIR